MHHGELTRRDCEACLRLLDVLEQASQGPEQFVRGCQEALRELAPSSQVLLAGPTAASGECMVLHLSAGGDEHLRLLVAREGRPFTARERARLALMEPHIAFLYGQACRNAQRPLACVADGITPREQEVLRWVSCGKTDADIAALLAISPRTVNKHLEHIYVKLGVETRTAAVMRAGRLA